MHEVGPKLIITSLIFIVNLFRGLKSVGEFFNQQLNHFFELGT